jgi:putative tricarboxylic transport membrane protein
MAVVASVFGGLFSLVVLMLIAPPLAKVALKFGPQVIFSLVIFGFSTIVGLSGSGVVKGLISGFLGLLLCTVGTDPVVGTPRFVFGNTALLSGINIMPVMIGLFALPEVVKTFIEGKRAGGVIPVRVIQQAVKVPFPSLKELKKCFWVLMYSSGIGTLLGAIPGTGGPVAAFIAYDQTKHFTKELGTGCLEGVAAPEASNNAVEGGSLIPLMTLGIPASGTMAILMGAFMIHGFVPGPLLFKMKAVWYMPFLSVFLSFISWRWSCNSGVSSFLPRFSLYPG